ncbi:MAG: dihydroorotase family protein [Methanomethylophilus sp.]
MPAEPETVIGGRMFLDGALRYGQIGIAGGKIVASGAYVSGGEQRYDFGTSMTLLPGFMDPHVHFRDPGMTQKEDFTTGSAGAVCGGVTCVLDMPNTKPPVTDLATLTDKKSAVRGRSYCDYGLFAAVTPGCPAALLAPHVPGFKLFMGSTTGHILMDEDEDLDAVMPELAAAGKPVSVHAEDDHLIRHGVTEYCNQDHLRDRPAEAEYSALRRLSRYRGVRFNICHCTNEPQLAQARALGYTTEVALHHLLFEAARFSSAEYKVNPPLRDLDTRDALFKSFLAGNADMFGTDHAPHTLEEKEQEYDAAPGGIPGVETTMPIVMEMVRRGIVPLDLAIRMGAEKPGEVFAAPKGRLAPGYDADFAVFDFRRVQQIDLRRLHSKAGHSPYAGWDAVFPDTVIIRGQVQVKDGELCGEPIGRDICG